MLDSELSMLWWLSPAAYCTSTLPGAWWQLQIPLCVSLQASHAAQARLSWTCRCMCEVASRCLQVPLHGAFLPAGTAAELKGTWEILLKGGQPALAALPAGMACCAAP